MAYATRKCPQCGREQPWKLWWPSDACPACRGTAREDPDPADSVESFAELLTLTSKQRAFRVNLTRDQLDQEVLAAIRDEKRRLGEGASDTSRFQDSGPCPRFRPRMATIKRR